MLFEMRFDEQEKLFQKKRQFESISSYFVILHTLLRVLNVGKRIWFERAIQKLADWVSYFRNGLKVSEEGNDFCKTERGWFFYSTLF